MTVRRLKHLSGPGLLFVTSVLATRLPVFLENDIGLKAALQFDETAKHFGTPVISYSFMPDHFHSMLLMKDITVISKLMQSFKSLSSRRIKEVLTPRQIESFFRDGRFVFWRRRFDEVQITSEEQFRTKMNYIHNNPVRAGLCLRAEEWPLSSAAQWSGMSAGPITVDTEFTWLKWLDDEDVI